MKKNVNKWILNFYYTGNGQREIKEWATGKFDQ